MPQVSILVPTYNHEKYAAAAIESVLAKSFTDFELIINDDASTDGTFAELKKFEDPSILLMRNDRNRGPCETSERTSSTQCGLCRRTDHGNFTYDCHQLLHEYF
jgi:cellulose synthase/poly-beta-1,6-N-acetylglucosamine synthase-like glycosyltransferase